MIVDLRYIRISGFTMRYFEDFLQDGTCSARLQSVTGVVHSLPRGVPEGTSTLFNIPLATLPLCVSLALHPPRIIVYADDICLGDTLQLKNAPDVFAELHHTYQEHA